MDIATENDVTPEAAIWLRERAGLSQAEFWRSVASNPASGCNYEQGNVGIPRTVRRLIFITYVAGLPTDASDSARAEGTILAGHALRIQNLGGVQRAQEIITETAAHLKKAARALGI